MKDVNLNTAGKTASAICTIIVLSVILSGCSANIVPASTEDGYSTDYAMSAIEYSLLLTKQLSVAENVLSTRVIMADSVIKGSYPASQELVNTIESIDKVTEAKDVLLTTMPALTYESDGQNTIDLMNQAIAAMNGYKTALENGDKDSLQAYAAEMRACFVAISAAANTEYY